MGRRGRGEGSIFRRKDGRWVAKLSLGGRRSKAFYGHTRAAVSITLDVYSHVTPTMQRQAAEALDAVLTGA